MKKKLMILRVRIHVLLAKLSRTHAFKCGLIGIGAADTFDENGKKGLPLAATLEVQRIKSL